MYITTFGKTYNELIIFRIEQYIRNTLKREDMFCVIHDKDKKKYHFTNFKGETIQIDSNYNFVYNKYK